MTFWLQIRITLTTFAISRQDFPVFRNMVFVLNWRNASLCRNRLRIMGCIISASGIQPTEQKVEAVNNAPRSDNSTQLRSFLIMVNYHGKFIKNLNTILHPLNRLLQKGCEFKWSPECERAFQSAKNSLSSANVLVHYNPELRLILECDASPYGVGAVIFHRFPDKIERPIAYTSRSLNAAEKNCSQIEKKVWR